jgi:hypothetical protein
MISANVLVNQWVHTANTLKEELQVGHSRIRKIKASPQPQQSQSEGDSTVFFMSLEEAKAAIMDKYEFLAERYEQQYPKHKGIT